MQSTESSTSKSTKRLITSYKRASWSAQILFKQHSHFRCQCQWCTKAWKWSMALFWIYWNQSVPPSLQRMKCNVWKPCRNLFKSAFAGRTSFRFKDFFELSATQNNHLLGFYCVTDQWSITRSGRSVLNFKFSVLTLLKWMSCLMSIEHCANRNTFNSNLCPMG